VRSTQAGAGIAASRQQFGDPYATNFFSRRRPAAMVPGQRSLRAPRAGAHRAAAAGARPVAARSQADANVQGSTTVRHALKLFAASVIALTTAACAARAPNIAALKHDTGRYLDRSVTVQGTVSSAWRVPLVDFSLYRVQDESGEVTVLSRSRHTPSRGAHVRVTGVVKDVASFGQSIGLHIQERDVDVLR
jgi:hypothetical protein